jgi:hypothetical protein
MVNGKRVEGIQDDAQKHTTREFPWLPQAGWDRTHGIGYALDTCG